MRLTILKTMAAGALAFGLASPAQAIPNALHSYDLNGSFADALGGNPTDADAKLRIEGSIQIDGRDSHLAITFERIADAADISYSVRVSSDLEHWDSEPGLTNSFTALVSIDDPDPDDGLETVTVIDRLAVSDLESPRFMTIAVEPR